MLVSLWPSDGVCTEMHTLTGLSDRLACNTDTDRTVRKHTGTPANLALAGTAGLTPRSLFIGLRLV